LIAVLAARHAVPASYSGREQHDRAASIEVDDVERILANIDAHRGNSCH
jgi:hypothetical protein